MEGFISGLTIGLLVGVSGTFLLVVGRLAFSYEDFSALSRLLYRSFVFITAALVVLAGIAHTMKLGKTSSLLLLFLAVLAIARHSQWKYRLNRLWRISPNAPATSPN
jgi:hypothetical protein